MEIVFFFAFIKHLKENLEETNGWFKSAAPFAGTRSLKCCIHAPFSNCGGQLGLQRRFSSKTYCLCTRPCLAFWGFLVCILRGIFVHTRRKGDEMCINCAAANCCTSQTMLCVRNAIFPWMLQRELLAKCTLNIHWMSPTCFDLITRRLNWFNPVFFFQKTFSSSIPAAVLTSAGGNCKDAFKTEGFSIQIHF